MSVDYQSFPNVLISLIDEYVDKYNVVQKRKDLNKEYLDTYACGTFISLRSDPNVMYNWRSLTRIYAEHVYNKRGECVCDISKNY